MKYMFIVLGACLMTLTGCAALEQMHEQWVRENCNPQAAFNNGLSDGLSPGAMPKRSYADSCPVNQPMLNEAYMRGFSQGLEKRPQQININKNVNVNNPAEHKSESGYYSAAPSTGYQTSAAPSTGYQTNVAPKRDLVAEDAARKRRQNKQMRRQARDLKRQSDAAIANAQSVMNQGYTTG